jgi:hypothetical protein
MRPSTLHGTVALLLIDVLIASHGRQGRCSNNAIVANRFTAAIISSFPKIPSAFPKRLIDQALMVWLSKRLETIRIVSSSSPSVPLRRDLGMVDAPRKNLKDMMNRVGFEPTRIAPLADSFINLKLAP